ncbi:hypothetical protein [Latilactobacillus fuchuensis]|jgi:hypothetical protein|uniref:Membrane protein n=2 Tax=Latilactobacillus fuchuensis TaxID=164393 RepID=A0A2N9DUR9_9LACO|nr:hypothetical protein [Latilactobacillus fuchuensis]KRL61462.1 hypothetical protein FC69_GL000679 [Latilactobacillus fuchuensis DSM 14340 = JCM 11249]MCP8857570.1 hypothetical protein [Latilactobacillus fuchuensis]SPC37938.1 putative membrane protein [Latilactobacillus fuchuensis]
MKISIRKLPFLYDLIFLAVTVIQSIIILVVNPHLTNFMTIYSDSMGKVWWLSLIAIVLHVVSYLTSLSRNTALFANLVAIIAYIIFILLPGYFIGALILLLIGLIASFKSYQFHIN